MPTMTSKLNQNTVFLSFRGESGVDQYNVLKVQSVWGYLNLVLGGGVTFMADNNAGSKDEIMHALDKAEAFVLILTGDYFESKWCAAEYIYAVKKKQKIAAIYWRDSDASKIISEKIISSRDYRQELLRKHKRYPDQFDLTEDDLKAAAAKLQNVLHIPLELKPYTMLEATVNDLLRRGLGYDPKGGRFKGSSQNMSEKRASSKKLVSPAQRYREAIEMSLRLEPILRDKGGVGSMDLHEKDITDTEAAILAEALKVANWQKLE